MLYEYDIVGRGPSLPTRPCGKQERLPPSLARNAQSLQRTFAVSLYTLRFSVWRANYSRINFSSPVFVGITNDVKKHSSRSLIPKVKIILCASPTVKIDWSLDFGGLRTKAINFSNKLKSHLSSFIKYNSRQTLLYVKSVLDNKKFY